MLMTRRISTNRLVCTHAHECSLVELLNCSCGYKHRYLVDTTFDICWCCVLSRLISYPLLTCAVSSRFLLIQQEISAALAIAPFFPFFSWKVGFVEQSVLYVSGKRPAGQWKEAYLLLKMASTTAHVCTGLDVTDVACGRHHAFALVDGGLHVYGYAYLVVLLLLLLRPLIFFSCTCLVVHSLLCPACLQTSRALLSTRCLLVLVLLVSLLFLDISLVWCAVSSFLMGTAALYRVCSTGLR